MTVYLIMEGRGWGSRLSGVENVRTNKIGRAREREIMIDKEILNYNKYYLYYIFQYLY